MAFASAWGSQPGEFWTLLQALAWIATSDRTYVARIGGARLDDAPLLEAQNAYAQDRGYRVPSTADSEAALLDALASGRLLASGETASGIRETLPARAWSGACLLMDGHSLVMGKRRPPDSRPIPHTRWTDYEVQGFQVLALWPFSPPAHWSASEAITWLAFGQAEDKQWITDRSLAIRRHWAGKTELQEIADWLVCETTSGRTIPDADRTTWVERFQDAHLQSCGLILQPEELLERVRSDLAFAAALASAEMELIEGCRSGRLTPWGCVGGDLARSPEDVPARVWVAGVSIQGDAMGPGPAGAISDFMRVRALSASLYTELTFRSEQVLALRAASKPSASGTRISDRKPVISELPPWLTAMQAVAWIVSRDDVVVSRASTETAPSAVADRILGNQEWKDDQPGLTLHMLNLGFSAECEVAGPSTEIPAAADRARDEVVRALRMGKVRASARKNDDGSRAEMPPVDWIDLTLESPDDGEGGRKLQPCRANGDTAMPWFCRSPQWSDPMFETAEIMVLWSRLAFEVGQPALQPNEVSPKRQKLERRDLTPAEFDAYGHAVIRMTRNLGMAPPNAKQLSKAVRDRAKGDGILFDTMNARPHVSRWRSLDRLGKQGIRHRDEYARPFEDVDMKSFGQMR